MRYCVDGWPDRNQLQGPVKHYWHERAALCIHNELLLRGSRLVIPSNMRNDVLEKVHEGHQGVVKCRERACQTVWWPGLSCQIRELVLKCRECIKERVNPKEPLMPTKLPDRPWQKLGADLFMLREKTYLLVVDYFSRYIEIAQLSPTRSMDVNVHLKSIFARHGIPETFISDNGPQFSGHEMKTFATDYCFEHLTSSPKYPQSNGEAERAVQTLKKANDPYKALLAYRATPLSNGYSPAELLMGRRLRTTLPILPERLQPALPDLPVLQQTEREKRWAGAKCFNSRHRARDLGKLSPGENENAVWHRGGARVSELAGSRSAEQTIWTADASGARGQSSWGTGLRHGGLGPRHGVDSVLVDWDPATGRTRTGPPLLRALGCGNTGVSIATFSPRRPSAAGEEEVFP
ncbi:hypothetical protein N1851_033839 [Merluccius polli]|uniref:Gypsy retrotransposon integrase-like protein 1 n=1 Tax=Merluccius polli TaxID=89951 RepID=A0AA47NP45_MERPO|nr:hypothetical protein N1851_033839 [Merluccius polli]